MKFVKDAANITALNAGKKNIHLRHVQLIFKHRQLWAYKIAIKFPARNATILTKYREKTEKRNLRNVKTNTAMPTFVCSIEQSGQEIIRIFT